MPVEQNTSFLINGPTYRIFQELVKTYIANGVQTVVAVANTRNNNYNKHSCFGTAQILSSRGVNVLGNFEISAGQSTSRVKAIVDQIASLNPDAVLWCDDTVSSSI